MLRHVDTWAGRRPGTRETLGAAGFPNDSKGFYVVGATGFEPVTPAVSRQCSAAELSARGDRDDTDEIADTATVEATPGIEPGYRVLQTLASPLGHVAITKGGHGDRPRGADDRVRTGDLNLGKVALYQLSYVRVGVMVPVRGLFRPCAFDAITLREIGSRRGRSA